MAATTARAWVLFLTGVIAAPAARAQVAAVRPAPGAPDKRVEWLARNALRIAAPESAVAGFDDLLPLAAALGDARVVQLGEPSHGDGQAFLAKCRLVEFLHEKLGFDVLAFESGFYTCAKMDQAFAAAGGAGAEADAHDLDAMAQLGVFPIWSASAQCRPVFEYALQSRAGDRPLELAGFDCQFSGTASGGFGADLAEYLDSREGLELNQEIADRLRRFAEAVLESPGAVDVAARAAGLAAVRAAQQAMAEVAEDRADAFHLRALRHFAVQVELLELFAAGGDREQLMKGSNLRDVEMGETLAWLADDYYAGRKIIVWAASRHIVRNLASVDTRAPDLDYAEFQNMGDVVDELLGRDAYTIVFDAYQGSAGIVGRDPFSVDPAEEGSFAWLCHQTGAPRLFVDLRGLEGAAGHFLTEPLAARPFGYAAMVARWNQVADAFYFIDAMTPSTRARE